MALILKQFDTFPPVTVSLSDKVGFIDLSSATSIKFIMMGTATLVTGTANKLTVVTPTANTQVGSSVLTAVSSFSSVVIGSSLAGLGIPAGAQVDSFNTVAQTIAMVDANGSALNATANGTGVTVTVNKGTVQYPWGATDTSVADLYSVEFEILWGAGGIQTVPNAKAANLSIQIDQDLEGA